MMQQVGPFFFGYGSLVNRATHDYPNSAHAEAYGWQRAWVDTPLRPYAYLTAIRAPRASISGLIAEVPNADWVALDEREDAYERIPDSDNINHTHPNASDVSIYAVPLGTDPAPAPKLPILLSYLDVVLQGYLKEFGLEGAEAFMTSTTNWGAVLNDRAQPIYPRAQVLSAEETDFVNNQLALLDLEIIEP